jgi:hypothetical protein
MWAEMVAVAHKERGRNRLSRYGARRCRVFRESHGFEPLANNYRRAGVALEASSSQFGRPTPAVHVETRP